MINKKFGVHFTSEGGALTLLPSEVSDIGFTYEGHLQTKSHPDGWSISAVVIEDSVEWVNYFQAKHPIFGKVWGDFEKEVFADSEEGFNDFISKHKPIEWDYSDI